MWTENGGGFGHFTYGPGQRDTIYVLDVDGERFVIHSDLDAIVASIDIQP